VEIEFGRKFIKIDKKLSDLDRFIISFIKILNKLRIKYVIVSGYVSIFFGRSRVTEDIDVLIEKIGFEKFKKLKKSLSRGFWFLNSEDENELYDMLKEKLSIRIAEMDKVIPNIEMKFSKPGIESFVLRNPFIIRIGKNRLLISPIEIQIPFKFYLGSEKDIEDALHLYELFKEKLNVRILRNAAKKLDVINIMKKYGVNIE